jgi:GT2 family glycosyltransferase
MGRPYKERALERQALVSVVIVNYNGGKLIEQAVRAVLRSIEPVEVFVSDNGSTDGSLSLLRTLAQGDSRLHVIELGQNLGFTRATNVALRRAAGDHLLLLNPDCIIEPGTIGRMLMAMADNPQAGMAGCLIRNPDGSEQVGCRRAVPTPWRSLVRVLHLNRLRPRHPRFQTFLLDKDPLPAEPTPLESISGAFMLVRREAMEQVGLLDEGYFLHCDDLDWCMRFRRAGWQILFVPDVEVVHYKGGCSGGKTLFVEWHKHKGMVRFYRKFFRHQYPLPLMGLVVAAVWARFGLIAAATVLRRMGGATERHEVPQVPLSAAEVLKLSAANADAAGKAAPSYSVMNDADSQESEEIHPPPPQPDYGRRVSTVR